LGTFSYHNLVMFLFHSCNKILLNACLAFYLFIYLFIYCFFTIWFWNYAWLCSHFGLGNPTNLVVSMLITTTCEEHLNLFFQFCFFLCQFFCKMTFSATIVVSSLSVLLFVLELPPIYTFLNFPKTPLTINVSCFIPWLYCTFHLHHNFYWSNCPHTNSIDNWSVRVLNETTKV
jgi:hypothetical protein